MGCSYEVRLPFRKSAWGQGICALDRRLKKVKRPEMFAELAAKLPEYKFVMVGGKGASEEESLHGVSEEFQQSANLNVVGLFLTIEWGSITTALICW